MQTIGADNAQLIAALKHDFYRGVPVFGVNDNFIAYADDGVWVINRMTGEIVQVAPDVPLAEDDSNMSEYRIYTPDTFVADPGGVNVKLVINAQFWEWDTSVVYDFDSGEHQELEGQVSTQHLPLSDGRALIYGNDGIAGEAALFIAPDPADINTYTELVRFSDLTEHPLLVQEAVETAFGHVRVVGVALTGATDKIEGFWFDVDVATGETSDVQLFTLVEDFTANSGSSGPLSPDGQMLVVFENTQRDEAGRSYGRIRLIDLMTGETFEAPLPETAGRAVWR